MTYTTEIIVLLSILGVIFVTSPFWVMFLARYDLFVTVAGSDETKFIVTDSNQEEGESLVRIVHDLKNQVLKNPKSEGVEKAYFTQGKGRNATWLERLYRVRWIGLPGLVKVDDIEILKVVPNESDEDPRNWISEITKEKVKAIRATITIPVLLLDVELKDAHVHLLVWVRLRLVVPYIPVVQLKGSYYRDIQLTLAPEVQDVVNDMTWEEFKAAEKGEVGGILLPLKKNQPHPTVAGKFVYSPVNKEMVRLTGWRIDGISISSFQPADLRVVKAMNLAAANEAEGNANIIAANKRAEVKKIDADADKYETEQRIEAEVGTFIAQVRRTGASDAEIIAAVHEKFANEALPKNLQALVQKGGSEKTVTNIPLSK